MMTIRRDPSDGAGAFNALRTGRVTWLGLAIAALGWLVLIAELASVDLIPAKLSRASSTSTHADILEIAKCAIASGFGIALIGALQTGFGALNRFFEAVLMRSANRQPAVVPDPVPSPMPMPKADTAKTPYRVLADGSVEVETILGTRRFASLAEAREFI